MNSWRCDVEFFFFFLLGKKQWRSMSCLYLQANKKIADAKLAKDFQAVLKEFQKAQRLSAERETAYTPFVPQAVLPSRYNKLLLDCLNQPVYVIICQ